MSPSNASWTIGVRGRTVFIAVLLLVAGSAASARTHRIYEFDRSRGLPATAVHGIGQDHRGFLWVGGTQTLYRYDGREFVRWNDTLLGGSPERFAMDATEGLIVKLSYPDLTLRRVTDDGLEPFAPALEPPLDRVLDVAADDSGGLWIADAAGLRHRNARGSWRTISTARFADRPPHCIRQRRGGGVIVAADRGVYRVLPDGDAERLVEAPEFVVAAQEGPSGDVFVTHGGGIGGNLTRLENGGLVMLANHTGRATDMIVRGDAVWMALDFALLRWHPSDGVERMRSEGGTYTGGGRFLLDHEGSLWIGGYANLIQMPEPATAIWTPDDGLPVVSMTFVRVAGEALWASSYGGLSVIKEHDGQRVAETPIGGFSPYPVCVDDEGRAWHARKDHYDQPTEIFESFQGRQRVHRLDGPGRDGVCTSARDGHVWFARGSALYATPRGGGAPHAVGLLPPDLYVRAMHESGDGTLWIAAEEVVCHATELPPRTSDAWSCENDSRLISGRSFVEPRPGELWINSHEGVMRRTEDGWRTVGGLPQTSVQQLVASPRGGVWVVGVEFVARVVPGDADPGTVDVVERLTLWQGLPGEGGSSLAETDGGAIWLATARGLVQLPAGVRDQSLPVPSVQLVGLSVEGRPQQLALDGLDLPHDRNDVEVFFAALSYRNRGLVRYRVRSDPEDPWRETRTPSFSFADLSPGEYRPEVAASLDGVNWTAEPAAFRIHVAPAWYATAVARVAFLLAALAALYALHRVRLAVQLQAERQRTRIAMDLHDEMGSGLGSIRILSDVLDQEGLPANDRQQIVGQIQHTAEELSVALADIVWSLRPRARRLGAVVARIETLARRLLPPPSVDVRLRVDGVDNSTLLSQPVCKNLLAIATEALHNAARHSRPSTVTVELVRKLQRLELTITDDGTGFDVPKVRAEGLGLSSMARRADDIGAQIDIRSKPGGGTSVVVRFDPQARDRRLLAGPSWKKGDPR